MRELKLLNEILNTPSTNGKMELLRTNATDTLKLLLYYTYNQFLTYRVAQLDMPDKFNTVQPDVSAELFMLLDLLAKHTTTPTEARGMIKRLLAKCTEEGAGWIAKVIKRDLKIGINVSTINKVFPDLVPEFAVPLAFPLIEPKTGEINYDKIRANSICEIKADGHRIIAACDGNTVNFFSRTGQPIETLDHLIPQIMALRPGTKFVLDGEGVALQYNPNCAVAKKAYEAGKNWKFAQAASMITTTTNKYSDKERRDCVGYFVWDLVDYDYFMSKGKKGTCAPLKYRKTELLGLFERQTRPFTGLQLSPTRLARDTQELMQIFREAVAAGEEGIMVKDPEALYSFKRSYDNIKVKEFYTADLRVLDCIEGKKGTKNEGSLGAILVGDGVVSGKVMGGWDADLGLNIWLRHLRGEMVDKILEIIYKEVTSDNSLRHGVFVRERPDKDECSWN